jgi:regulator of replication initiation timing
VSTQTQVFIDPTELEMMLQTRQQQQVQAQIDQLKKQLRQQIQEQVQLRIQQQPLRKNIRTIDALASHALSQPERPDDIGPEMMDMLLQADLSMEIPVLFPHT